MKTFKCYDGRLCHVINETFDEKTQNTILTYRWYSKSRQRWMYAADVDYIINIMDVNKDKDGIENA